MSSKGKKRRKQVREEVRKEFARQERDRGGANATGGQAEMRASDADRDDVIAQLRDHAAEGRLEPDELDERIDAALAARTFGELDVVLTDLPSRPPRARRGRPERRHHHGPPFPRAFALVPLVFLAVWAISDFGGSGGDDEHHWVIFPLIWIGFGLLHAGKHWLRHRDRANV